MGVAGAARRPSRRGRRWSSCSAASGALVGEPRPIEHEVKYYEKGDRPLEIVTSRQWYIRNGARDAGRRDALLASGRALQWHPEFMRVRYEHWVEGLNTDWLISRQRYFGVPFPLWYPVGDDGEPRWDEPDRGRRVGAADRPAERRPCRASTRPSAASPADSSAIPT